MNFTSAGLLAWALSIFGGVSQLLIFALKILGVNYYHCEGMSACRVIDRIKPITSGYNITTDTPDGMFISRWGIGYIHRRDNNAYLSILGFIDKEKMVQLNEEDDKFVKTIIQTKRGRYAINVECNPYPHQGDIMDKIIAHYHTYGYARCFIYGESGAGKSSIARFLATELGIGLTMGVPITDDISKVFEVNRGSKSVIIFDEVDIIIERFDNESSMRKDNHVDKVIWNAFLNNAKIYIRGIIIMTSNKSPQEITDDPSIIQSHRFDIVHELIKY